MSYEGDSVGEGAGTSLLPDIRADEKPQIASECSRVGSLWSASSMSVGRKIQGQLSARMATRSVRSRETPSRESRARRRSTWPRVVGRESGPGTAVPAKAGRIVRRRFASTALSLCACPVECSSYPCSSGTRTSIYETPQMAQGASWRKLAQAATARKPCRPTWDVLYTPAFLCHTDRGNA